MDCQPCNGLCRYTDSQLNQIIGVLMQYLGGKSKTRKQISAFLESVRKPDQTYFEPFVGGAWILQEMGGKRIASDGNKALIAMYKALQNGWVPPTFVSEEEWRKWRYNQELTRNPMQAFCRFGCGFGGDWMGGVCSLRGKTLLRTNKP